MGYMWGLHVRKGQGEGAPHGGIAIPLIFSLIQDMVTHT